MAESGAAASASTGEVRENTVGGPLHVQFSRSFDASSSFGIIGNTADSLDLSASLRFDARLSVLANVTPSLTLGFAAWGDAQVEIAQHADLNAPRVSGSVEGNPTLGIRQNSAVGFTAAFEGVGALGLVLSQNTFQQAPLDLGGAVHRLEGEALRCGRFGVDLTRTAGGPGQRVDCRMNDLSVDYGFTWNALRADVVRLDLSLNNLKVNGDFTLNTKAEGHVELGEGSAVQGTASITIQGNVTELRSTRISYEGGFLVNAGGVEAGLTIRSQGDRFGGNFTALVDSPGVFVVIDLSEAIWGQGRKFHAACPGGRQLAAKQPGGLVDQEGRRRPLETRRSLIVMRDVTEGPSTFGVDNLDVPVRLERCRFRSESLFHAIDLIALSQEVTILDCQVDVGNLNLRRSTSPVTIEGSQFRVTALGQSAISLETRSATLRNNQVKASAPATAGVSLEVKETAVLEDNTIEGLLALVVEKGTANLKRNTFIGNAKFDNAAVVAHRDSFRGYTVIEAAASSALPTFTGVDFLGSLALSSWRIAMRESTVQGMIFISEGSVPVPEHNSIRGTLVVDLNPTGGLTQDPVAQGAAPENVTSPIDFDQDPQHCADYPTQLKDDGTCLRPGVPVPR